MEHILFFVLLFVWCVIIAELEVNIEGKDGWAKNLPTTKYMLQNGELWYKSFDTRDYREPECNKLMQKFYIFYIRKILGGREFTRYHRVVDIMQLFVGHLLVYMLYFGKTSWWNLELRVIACIWLSWSIEDTLWFFFNPFYGIKKYKPEFIPWHASDWWIFAPKGMLILFFQGCGLYFVTYLLQVFNF